jgi:hypothetical protein
MKLNFTYQNYIQEIGNGDTFDICLNTLPKKFKNYFEESLIATEIIESSKIGKLYIMYSGGVDSEYALNLFLYKKIPIQPVIVKFLPDYNLHDISYALKFCEKHKLDPLIIDIDYDDFVKSGKMLEYAKMMKSAIPHYTTTAYAISKLNGTIICGDGEPYITKNQDNTWDIFIYEYDYSLTNFYKHNNIYGVVHFNRYTPEMMRSFLEDSRIKDLANNKVPGKLGSNSSKYLIYNRDSNFNMEQRQKYNGLEIIETKEIKNHESFEELKKLGNHWNGFYKKNYFQFLKENCEN